MLSQPRLRDADKLLDETQYCCLDSAGCSTLLISSKKRSRRIATLRVWFQSQKDRISIAPLLTFIYANLLLNCRPIVSLSTVVFFFPLDQSFLFDNNKTYFYPIKIIHNNYKLYDIFNLFINCKLCIINLIIFIARALLFGTWLFAQRC